MKILLIDYDDLRNPYAGGGQARITRELVTRLKKRNTITVLSGNFPGAKDISTKNLSVKHIGYGNVGSMTSLLTHWVLLPFYVYRLQKNADIIVEYLTAPFGASLVPFIARKTLVALPMFFDTRKLAHKYHLPFDFVQRNLLRFYRHFIVLTEHIQKETLKLNTEANINVIPGGVDRKILAAQTIKGKYVLYLGRIDNFNKGVMMLLNIWKDIDVPLVIAGNGKPSDIAAVKKTIVLHKLENKVSYIGRVDGQKKVDLFRKSLFVVQPSFFETFGFVALETLAAGKLLVCFDIPGFAWIPKQHALKITPFTEKALLKGVQKALSSSTLVKKSTATNKTFARKFDWERIAASYEKAFKAIYEK